MLMIDLWVMQSHVVFIFLSYLPAFSKLTMINMKFTYMVIILLNVLLNINGKDNALRNIKYITMEGQAQFR